MVAFFLANILGILATPLFIRVVWKNWHLPVSVPLTAFASLVFFICVISLFGLTIEKTTVRVDQQLNLLLSFTIPMLWFWVTYEFIKREKIPLQLIRLLLIEPAFLIIIVLFNNFLDLSEIKVWGIKINAGETLVSFSRIVHAFYALGLVLFSLIWLAKYLLQSSSLGVLKISMLIAVLFLPSFSGLLYAVGVLPFRLGAPLSIVMIALGVSRFKLLDVIPIARDKIVDQLKDGVAILNRKGLIVDANSFACELLNLPSDVVNKTLEKQSNRCPDMIAEKFDFTEIEPQMKVLNLTDTQNEHCFINTELLPLLDNKQEIIGYLLLLQDITEQQESKNKREYYIRGLEKLDQLKSDFLTNISHEFRTPLTLSIGPVNDILNGKFGRLPTEINQRLMAVNKHNQHLLALINQLLDLSRLESVDEVGHSNISESSDSIAVITAMAASFETLALKKKIDINVHSQSEYCNVAMALTDCEKIMSNLLSNAFKSIENEGAINIHINDVDDGFVEISIADTGCGIDEKLVPHIFERFYYSEHQHPQWSASTGIGLALVKQLIERRGGEISVSSEVGIGSTFVIILRKPEKNQKDNQSLNNDTGLTQSSLPILISHDKELEQTTEQSAEQTTELADSAKHEDMPLVLIVEDNNDMRGYIVSHLTADYQVLTAKDGDEGWLMAQEHIPDLIVSDIMMPGINGIDLCTKIKSEIKTSHIPLILLSAKADIKNKMTGLSVEANDYLTKPFYAEELKLRVNNLISLQIKSREYYRQTFSDSLPLAVIEQSTAEKKNQEEKFLALFKQFLIEKIAVSELKISQVAQGLAISEKQLQRKLKTLTGKSPSQLLLEMRLHYSQDLLLRGKQLSITEISHASGFSSSSYFSKRFKQAYGQSPTEYKNKKMSS